MRKSQKRGLFMALCLLGIVLGNVLAVPQTFGPCSNWNCTGGPFDGTYTPVFGPPNTKTCVVNSGVVPTCQNTDQNACDPEKSKKTPFYYACQGKDATKTTCYVWFYGCQ